MFLENRRAQAPFFDRGAGVGQTYVIGVDLGEFHRDDVKRAEIAVVHQVVGLMVQQIVHVFLRNRAGRIGFVQVVGAEAVQHFVREDGGVVFPPTAVGHDHADLRHVFVCRDLAVQDGVRPGAVVLAVRRVEVQHIDDIVRVIGVQQLLRRDIFVDIAVESGIDGRIAEPVDDVLCEGVRVIEVAVLPPVPDEAAGIRPVAAGLFGQPCAGDAQVEAVAQPRVLIGFPVEIPGSRGVVGENGHDHGPAFDMLGGAVVAAVDGVAGNGVRYFSGT